MAYEARYLFKAGTGADMAAVTEYVRQGADLWAKHGAARPTLWSVTSGEIGQYVLVVRFDDAAAYGRVADALAADPAFRSWQAHNTRNNTVVWQPSKLVRELPI